MLLSGTSEACRIPIHQPCIIQCLRYAHFEHSLWQRYDVGQFHDFVSFFWYFLVSAIAIPLTLAPAREMAPKEILTGRPMNVLNVATLDIPEAILRPLEQAFSHVNQSKVLEYFSCFFLYLSSSLSNSCHFPGSCLGGRIVGLREMKGQVGELDATCLKGIVKMADIEINPFSNHDKMDAQPDEMTETVPLNPRGIVVGGSATWASECKQETSFRGKTQRTRFKEACIEGLY